MLLCLTVLAVSLFIKSPSSVKHLFKNAALLYPCKWKTEVLKTMTSRTQIPVNVYAPTKDGTVFSITSVLKSGLVVSCSHK